MKVLVLLFALLVANAVNGEDALIHNIITLENWLFFEAVRDGGSC